MVLVGILLTGVFNALLAGLKKEIAAKQLQQKVVQYEVFQQRIKNLFASELIRVSFEKKPEATSQILSILYKNFTDPELELRGTLRAQLFLNGSKELCLDTGTPTESKRSEVLLDHVDSFKCQFFDPRKGEWLEGQMRHTDTPAIVKIVLECGGNKIPFVFFPKSVTEPITYSGSS